MQGFQPAASRLAQLPQHLADGGAVGFGARGLAGLRDLVPKMAAMGYPQAGPAPAPAPPPPTDARAAQLQAMIPRMEALGYKQQPQYLASGGVVRGPGTGTSDSIEAEAEPGTFIMPADSTQAIGPSALEKLGTVPVRLSDGEFEVPPEQVMALGVAVLKLMKDATHTPVNGEDGGQTDEEVAEARGFQPSAAQRMQEVPEQLFADGGAVGFSRINADQWAQEQEQGRNDLARQEARQARVREDQAAADAEAVAQSEAFRQRQAEGASAATGYADGGLVDPARRPNSFGDAAAVASDPSTTQVRTSAADTFGRPPAPAPAPAAPAPALGSNLAAVTRMGTYTDPRSTAYDPNPYAASNAAKLAGSGQSSRATVEAGMAPAPQPPTAGNSFGDAAAATRDAGVTQVAGFQPGRGTVSTVPAQPVAPRTPAAPAVATAPAAGFQTAAQRLSAAPSAAPAQPPAPMGWADRNAQRNLEVTAASIMDSPERRAAQQRLGLATAATGFQPRRFADGGLVEDDLQKRLAQIPAGGPPGWTGGAGSGGGAGAAGGAGGVTGSWSAPEAAPAPPPPPPNGALSRAAGYISQSPAPAERALSAIPAASPPAEPISAQSMDAAQGLARRGAADAMATLPAAAPQTSVQAPVVRHSGNDWQARKDLENARTSALSITNRPEWSNSGMNRFRGQGGVPPDVAAFQAMLSNDLALRGAQPGLDQAAMRETGENQRTGMQVTASSNNAAADRMGALDRTLITERGNNTRAGISAEATTEAARLRAAQENKPPAGYRWAAGGKLEPIPGGPAADGKPLTEDQAKSAGYALRMDNALKLIDEVGKSNPGAIRPGALAAATNALPETLANTLRPEARQRVEAAQLDALDAALTLNTGAAYTREQLQGLSRSYFAQPGDDDKTVADKGNRLQSLIDTARLRAGEKGAAMTDVAQAKNAARTGGTPAAAPTSLPGGMSRQVGTSGGRPVFEDAQGNRFIGG